MIEKKKNCVLDPLLGSQSVLMDFLIMHSQAYLDVLLDSRTQVLNACICIVFINCT